MRAKVLALLAISILALVSAIGFACGDSDDGGTGGDAAPDDQTGGTGDDSLGAIVPNTFLTYEGDRYRLAEIIQADLADETEFSEVIEGSEADLDGDLTVYTRDGDSASVYTFWEGSGSGDEAVPDSWYKWDPAE